MKIESPQGGLLNKGAFCMHFEIMAWQQVTRRGWFTWSWHSMGFFSCIMLYFLTLGSLFILIITCCG